jgi:hypothetical protein
VGKKGSAIGVEKSWSATAPVGQDKMPLSPDPVSQQGYKVQVGGEGFFRLTH